MVLMFAGLMLIDVVVVTVVPVAFVLLATTVLVADCAIKVRLWRACCKGKDCGAQEPVHA